MRTNQVVGAAIALGLVSLSSGVAVAADEPMSVHRYESLLHAHEGLAPRILPDELPTPRAGSLARVVYGYYPFWVADLTTIRWSALTHLAWFSVDLDSAGEVESVHGWPDSEVVEVAHAAGVRVDLTFTLFGSGDIEALCTSPSRRATAIDNMISLMESGGADGISVDFEFVNGATRDAFVTFIGELRAALDERGHPNAEISIAGPAVDWDGGIDLSALLDLADWYFVMGYGYFWSGSSHAGPTGMLRVTADWAPYQSRSMLRTIADYSKIIEASKRHRIIWGVPYYGREWTTTSGDMGASTTANLGAVTYSQAKSDLMAGFAETLWHEGVANRWYRWQQSSTWHQVFFDDAESLAAKYDLALAQDLGGVGMWALNYDRPHSELWDLLETTFASLPESPEGHRHAPIVIETLPFHDSRDTSEGASHYFNFYSCAPDVPEFGREWVYRIDVCQPGTLMASVPAYPDRDPDLHLLDAPDQDACLDRAHTELETAVGPGRYLLVVDTYVDMPVEREGAYDLDVDFVPEPGSTGCAAHLACDAGACVCAEAGLTDCGTRCVDTATDADNCGGCGNACSGDERCVAGQCEAPGAPEPETAPATAAPLNAGCTCRAAPASPPSGAWLSALGLLALRSRRRRRRR